MTKILTHLCSVRVATCEIRCTNLASKLFLLWASGKTRMAEVSNGKDSLMRRVVIHCRGVCSGKQTRFNIQTNAFCFSECSWPHHKARCAAWFSGSILATIQSQVLRFWRYLPGERADKRGSSSEGSDGGGDGFEGHDDV